MCVDVSGSMAGERLDKAKALSMFYGIQAVNRNIPFVLVPFSGSAKYRVFEGNDLDTKSEFINYVLSLYADGGTDYSEAISVALKSTEELNVSEVDLLFISDGEPSDEPDNRFLNIDDVYKSRVFVGVGQDLDKRWENFFTKKLILDQENFHEELAMDLDDYLRHARSNDMDASNQKNLGMGL
jgi:uncharacterized protein YegL